MVTHMQHYLGNLKPQDQTSRLNQEVLNAYRKMSLPAKHSSNDIPCSFQPKWAPWAALALTLAQELVAGDGQCFLYRVNSLVNYRWICQDSANSPIS